MKILLTAVLAALVAVSARAEDKAKPAPAPAKSSWSQFLKNVRNSLSRSAVGGERNATRGSQVAAVRGKKQKNMADPNEPTLKGDRRSAKDKMDAQYDAELDASVELLEKGEVEKGIKGLEAFKAAHPKHRAEDVDKLIEGAKAAQSDKGAAAPAAKE